MRYLCSLLFSINLLKCTKMLLFEEAGPFEITLIVLQFMNIVLCTGIYSSLPFFVEQFAQEICVEVFIWSKCGYKTSKIVSRCLVHANLMLSALLQYEAICSRNGLL